MAESPYLSEEVKTYIRKFQLEKLINSTVNQILKKKPEDPFGFMIGILQKSASSDVQLVGLKAIQNFSGEGFCTLKLLVSVNYLNKPIEFMLGEPVGILDDQAIEFDADRFGGKGISKAVQIFNEKLAEKIVQFKCSEQIDIDQQLEGVLKEVGNSSLYGVNTASYAMPRIAAHVTSQPLFKIFASMVEKVPSEIEYMVNCLEGGKAIGSKCKVFKYTIISKKGKHDPFLAQNVLAGVRKAIVGGKGGEAALKYSSDRTFVCPVDTIADNLKIVEQAINTANAKDFYTIGLSWAADTLFSADTKKYELENPKTPFDSDQMIDYLVKLCIDKPVISYLEDPLAASEQGSWKKLQAKLLENDATKHVTLGTRNQKLLNLKSSKQELKNSLNELSVLATADSHPDLSPEDLQAKNADKFSLDYVQCRAFDLNTVSNLLSIQKILSKTNTKLILQDNFYETYDSILVDLCMGIGAIMNFSSINPGKYDRVSKLVRINEIFELNNKSD